MPYDRGRYQDKWRLERLARQIRERLGLSQTDILDPWDWAEGVPAHVLYPEDLGDDDLAARLREVGWDGGAFVFPNEMTLIVVLNPARSKRRQCATLLEELSHHVLGHTPSRIYQDPATGLLRRNFNPEQEAEAFDFGSVLLLPKELIQRHVKVTRGTASELADRCGCSVDLVELRIKRCRLWDRYVATCVV
jgi:Zn-dependent peptidase ImmA (M78 family)